MRPKTVTFRVVNLGLVLSLEIIIIILLNDRPAGRGKTYFLQELGREGQRQNVGHEKESERQRDECNFENGYFRLLVYRDRDRCTSATGARLNFYDSSGDSRR